MSNQKISANDAITGTNVDASNDYLPIVDVSQADASQRNKRITPNELLNSVLRSNADAETPTGTINSSNAVFTLAHAPSPAASLQLFKNGSLLAASGTDYTLSGLTITYTAAATPQTGDSHVAFYRY